MSRALLSLALASAAFAQTPARVLILTGQTDPAHNWQETAPMAARILTGAGRFTVRTIEEPRGITTATLAPYDALLLIYNGPRFGRETESAIQQFVRSGKGLVTFHGMTYGPLIGTEQGADRKFVFRPESAWPEYSRMLGAFWKPEDIGHSLPHAFQVRLTDREHPITRGMDPDFTASDELYHKMVLRPEARVLGVAFNDTAMRGTGKDEPILWTVPYGKGRVFYTSLGHDTAAMYNAGFATLLARAAEWAATGEVTQAAKPHPRDAVRVLVVTGGHAYPAAFFTLFEGREDIVWSHAGSPVEAFRPGLEKRYDVLVLHDMHEDLPEPQRQNLRAFVEAGKGVVSLHHAIVDYTAWPWWHQEVIGGKYFTKTSSFKEDVEVTARPVRSHPVTRGVFPLVLHDEVYKDMWHSPKITVLMETDHPLNDRPVVYIGPGAGKARAIYIQLGHSAATMRHPGYRRLVHNAILWAGGKSYSR